jgi:predicted DNA-binding transcriptional regulator AlpA
MVTKLEKLLVSYAEMKDLGIPFTREHISRLTRKGKFPQAIRLGGDDQSARCFWRYADILAWVEKRAEITPTLPTKRPQKAQPDGSGSKGRKNTAPADEARL